MKKYYLLFLTSFLSLSAWGNEVPQSKANIIEPDLVSVYAKIFNETVKRTELFLETIDQSKQYFEQELFQESLPWYRKTPNYWVHKNSYIAFLHKRIALLQEIEDQVAQLLGIALSGQYEFSKLTKQQVEIKVCLKKNIMPLYTYFHVDCSDFSHQQLFQDAQLFSSRIQSEIEKIEKVFAPVQKPHHIVQHKIKYTSAVIALAAMVIVYETYKDQIPVWKAKGKEAFDNFAQTCCTSPMQGLKEILIENKNIQIKPLDPAEFKKCENDITHNRFAQWLGISKDIDTVPETLNTALGNGCNFINQFVPVAESILTSQQINFYLAAIAPALILTYGGYRSSNQLYDCYVRNDWRYKPMKNVVRRIHRVLINVENGCQNSFVNNGKLHVLILKLKSYMYCLSNEELKLFQEDIAALLSFDLTYAQKQGVVESMYKTYGFLK
ncbi:MAG TPA: hypothetical protein VLG50_01470 [Candidatus Saccharimonadales bacterium]|nr:hypothetical protein [Candidatus Saccharimonadales bacterium]